MEEKEKLERLKKLHQEICELEAFSLEKEERFEKDLERLSDPVRSIYRLQRRINDIIDMYNEGRCRHTCSEEEMRERVNFWVSIDKHIQGKLHEKILGSCRGHEREVRSIEIQDKVNNYLNVRGNLDNLRKEINQKKSERDQLMLELGMTLSPDNSLVHKKKRK